MQSRTRSGIQSEETRQDHEVRNGKRPVPACASLEEIFYGPFESGPGSFAKKENDHDPDADRAVREAKAKALCNGCPYFQSCREFALINKEEWGVWGGMTEGERREFRIWCNEWGWEAIPKLPWLNDYIEAFWLDRYSQALVISDDNGVARARSAKDTVRSDTLTSCLAKN
jgi:WhiB family transcriptional regulator, redox-sensing transcriptional regulator